MLVIAKPCFTKSHIPSLFQVVAMIAQRKWFSEKLVPSLANPTQNTRPRENI